MKKKKIVITLVILLIAVVTTGFVMSNMMAAPKEVKKVDVLTIHHSPTSLVLTGEIKSKETEKFHYDYNKYGEYQKTLVTLGQYVTEGDIIIESGKKDYKAPFNGYITQLNVDKAYAQAKDAFKEQVIPKEQEILYTLTSDEYYIESEVNEYEVSRLPVQRKITYLIKAAGKQAEYQASVRTLDMLPKSNEMNTTTQTRTDVSLYTLLLNIDTGKEHTRIGNHVTVRIEDAEQPPLTIPTAAVLSESDRYYVYLIIKDNQNNHVISKQEVRGEFTAEAFRVERGLSEGDLIVQSELTNVSVGEVIPLSTP